MSFVHSMSAFHGRPDVAARIRESIPCRGGWKSEIPIVYCEEYNIRAFGLEKLHPLDTCKFGKIVSLLEEAQLCRRADLPSPVASTDEDLTDVHSEAYLEKLHRSKFYVCQVLEFPWALVFPKFLLRRCLIDPVRFHVGGTVLAMGLAVERGWAINLGGGAHHARRDHGEGWCFFADAMIGIRQIRRITENKLQKVLYIDCDVHQGNGVERDKQHFKDADLFILDVYNTDIWPRDHAAKKAIDISIGLHTGTNDEEYLSALQQGLEKAQQYFKPDLVVYNSGTDILLGDSLGQMRVTPDGVLKRDEMVFQHAVDVQAPIVMLLSGGYTKHTHKVIADSILNLSKKFDLIQPSS